jgi:hypothetical protein
VAAIISKLESGDVFNTYSPSTDKCADVHKYTCAVKGCEVETLRSAADAVTDNNLDNLTC